MSFKSTRCDKEIEAAAAMLNSPAEDGGVYIDEGLAEGEFSWRPLMEKSSAEIAAAVISRMLPGIDGAGEKAAELFSKEPQPLELKEDIHMLRGIADFGAQLLPYLASWEKPEGSRAVFISLNKGLSSASACKAFRGFKGTELLVFCPEDNMSAEERELMESLSGENVKLIFVKGGYDDCAKALRLAGEKLYPGLKEKNIFLSDAGSDSIVSVAVNTACCFIAYASLVKGGKIKAGEDLSFALPANDLGAAMACLYAKEMGLPIESVICANNSNRCLTEFIKTGVFDKNRRAVKTLCPAMDLLVPSGLERLVYSISEGDRKYTESNMKSFYQWGTLRLSLDTLLSLQESFEAYSFEDEKIASAMDALKNATGPMEALAYLAAQSSRESFMGCDSPVVLLCPGSFKAESGGSHSECEIIEKDGVEAFISAYLA